MIYIPSDLRLRSASRAPARGGLGRRPFEAAVAFPVRTSFNEAITALCPPVSTEGSRASPRTSCVQDGASHTLRGGIAGVKGERFYIQLQTQLCCTSKNMPVVIEHLGLAAAGAAGLRP